MMIDGRAIAQKIKKTLSEELKGRDPLVLSIFVLTDNFATQKFVSIKQKVAEEIGVNLKIHNLPEETTTEQLISSIQDAATEADGIVVQFPLPEHIDRDAVRNAIPLSHDVDVISEVAINAFVEGKGVLPPVAGAFAAIVAEHNLDLSGKRMVIVGKGRLVGMPAALWGKSTGAHVHVLDAQSPDMKERIKEADVLVLGAGVAGLIKPEMVKEGVIIFDAGTSEAAGELKGDADPTCADKAALFTPVPGGIGPITVALIFRNLVDLAKKRT